MSFSALDCIHPRSICFRLSTTGDPTYFSWSFSINYRVLTHFNWIFIMNYRGSHTFQLEFYYQLPGFLHSRAYVLFLFSNYKFNDFTSVLFTQSIYQTFLLVQQCYQFKRRFTSVINATDLGLQTFQFVNQFHQFIRNVTLVFEIINLDISLPSRQPSIYQIFLFFINANSLPNP